MILSGQAIEQLVNDGDMEIIPFIKGNIRGASYTFTLASNLQVAQPSSVVSLDNGFKFTEITIDSNGYLLQPNQFVLGSSQEILRLKDKFACFFSTRGSCAQIGLSVLLGSTFAEPNTDSQITLEIHNASQSPIILRQNMPIVKGIFSRIE